MDKLLEEVIDAHDFNCRSNIDEDILKLCTIIKLQNDKIIGLENDFKQKINSIITTLIEQNRDLTSLMK